MTDLKALIEQAKVDAHLQAEQAILTDAEERQRQFREGQDKFMGQVFKALSGELITALSLTLEPDSHGLEKVKGSFTVEGEDLKFAIVCHPQAPQSYSYGLYCIAYSEPDNEDADNFYKKSEQLCFEIPHNDQNLLLFIDEAIAAYEAWDGVNRQPRQVDPAEANLKKFAKYLHSAAFQADQVDGMSLREYFAAAAMQGVAMRLSDPNAIAKQALTIADATLAELFNS